LKSRAATATIKGYYYQFDTSILKLLELSNDTDSITIEGIEDIDINMATDSNTIQCKYLSKPTFINSAVREPIMLMLEHFINPAAPNNWKYTLYAHFENETPGGQPLIDLSKLKEILTYSEKKVAKCYYKDAGISDSVLTSFLSQFNLIFGEEFAAQQKKVLGKLKAEFACSEFEADTHFYNNALRIIIDKAIKPNTAHRKIRKADFLKEIDCRKRLFNEWYVKLRSKKEYLNTMAHNIRTSRAFEHSRVKFIIIGNDILSADNLELPLIPFIENLVNKYYKMGSAFRTAKPMAIVLDCDNGSLISIKQKLIANGVLFNDGYEHIGFTSNVFNDEPIINRSRNGNRIVKSSYQLKIITLHTLISNITTINIPKVVLHFSKNDCPYSCSAEYQFFDIKYCEDLKDISNLIL